MDNRDKGAFACVEEKYLQDGLTKREYFAGLAMQGFMSVSNRAYFANVAKESVQMADTLLMELDK